MATKLTDIIIPEVYESYQTVDDPELTALADAGVVVSNPALNAAANQGGHIVTMPFWNDLDPSVEPNYSDDSSNTGGVEKITTGEQVARMAYLNKGWSAYDLVGEMAGSDPMRRIRTRTSMYWRRAAQRRIVAMLVGVYNSNVNNDSSDMVSDIAASTAAAVTDNTVWSRKAFTGAAFTLGDMFESTTAIAVHSMVYKRMVDNNDVAMIPDSEGNLTIPSFLGRRIVVDDALPVVASNDTFKYTSILFQAGAIGFGSGTPATPVEVERDAKAGSGGGQETLWERKSWLLHPSGHKFNSAVLNGGTASAGGKQAKNSDLADEANWTRVVARKNVPLAFLVTNA